MRIYGQCPSCNGTTLERAHTMELMIGISEWSVENGRLIPCYGGDDPQRDLTDTIEETPVTDPEAYGCRDCGALFNAPIPGGDGAESVTAGRLLTAADLLEDPRFYGLSVQPYREHGDERMPVGDPQLFPRSYGHALLHGLMEAARQSTRLTATPLFTGDRA